MAKKADSGVSKFNMSKKSGPAGSITVGKPFKPGMPGGSVTPVKVDRSGKNLGGSRAPAGSTGPTNSPNGTHNLKK